MQESFGLQNFTPKIVGDGEGSVQMEKKRLVKKKKSQAKSKSKSKSPTRKVKNGESLTRKGSPTINVKERVV